MKVSHAKNNDNGRAKATPVVVAREFELEIVKFFADVVQVLGVPRSVGQIYGLLFASARPLSFQDIVDRLRISKGSASQGLRLLRVLSAVREISAARQPRELFVPELGLRKLVGGVLRGPFDFRPNMEGVLAAALEKLRAAGAALIEAGEFPGLPATSGARIEVMLYEMKDGLNAYLATLGPGAATKSLADLIRFNETHAEQELPLFGQQHFTRAQAKVH